MTFAVRIPFSPLFTAIVQAAKSYQSIHPVCFGHMFHTPTA